MAGWRQADMKSACAQAQTSYMHVTKVQRPPWGTLEHLCAVTQRGCKRWECQASSTWLQPSPITKRRGKNVFSFFAFVQANARDVKVRHCRMPLPAVLQCITQPVFGGSTFSPHSWAVSGRPANRFWQKRISPSLKGSRRGTDASLPRWRHINLNSYHRPKTKKPLKSP